jgi:hypothetical protein
VGAEGAGFTVMVKFCAAPVHEPNVGVMLIVAIAGVALGLLATKALIFPLPDAPSPIDGFEFTQLNVAPAVPVKLTAEVVAPAQTD